MFTISTRIDYGLILLRALAVRYKKRPIPLKVVATENGLPYNYLAQIVIPLKKAGLVESFEGVQGGYRLSKNPSAISFKEIADALEPQRGGSHCLLGDHGVCRQKEGCSVSPWWEHFNTRFQKMIKQMTLADLL